MGLLTNPSTSVKKWKYAKILIKFNRLICVLLYVTGLLWFCALGHSDLNNATYFSENALLPGLVYSEIKSETTNYALNLMDELNRERETYKNGMPYAWLLAKMHQIGLDTYTHNFTLKYPLGGGNTNKIFKGKNVYGILRAPRIGSTESFVISAPYRPPNSIQTEITHSIPILLAFASYARRQKYWAKDIIFLITEQEQLGMQAWLEAYQGADENDYLKSGTLDARAGSIQAAINLELQSFNIEYIDVKVEGLNGQLPNLDLFNLVQRLSLKEGLPSGHKQSSTRRRSGAKSSIEDNLKHMLSMVVTQSTGIPNGNHGLFHRFGIESLTLEGYKKTNANYHRTNNDVSSLLKIIEGISRSLNNLLERFHQSFFFYLLLASDRFVSIGDYMPSLGLMAGSLLIKAFILWLQINQPNNSDNDMVKPKKIQINSDVDDEHRNVEVDGDYDVDDNNKEAIEIAKFLRIDKDFNFLGIGKLLIAAHTFGVFTLYLPFFTPLNNLLFPDGTKTEIYLFYIFFSINIIALIIPYYIKLGKESIEILHIAALLELGTVLIIVGMLNFSLGLLLCIFLVPFAILVTPNSGLSINFARFIGILLNPLMAIFLIIMVFTHFSFGKLTIFDLVKKSSAATIDAITYSVFDSIIYGNWLHDLITVIFFPIWIQFWIVLFSSRSMYRNEVKQEVSIVISKKIN